MFKPQNCHFLFIIQAFAFVTGDFLVDGDPHFMIEIDRGDALCFNINGNPGTVFNLVRDVKSGQTQVSGLSLLRI